MKFDVISEIRVTGKQFIEIGSSWQQPTIALIKPVFQASNWISMDLNSPYFYYRLLTFFSKLTYSKNFQEHYQSGKWFESRTGKPARKHYNVMTDQMLTEI